MAKEPEMGNQSINPRRGMKDNWAPTVNPGKSGGEKAPKFGK